MATGTATLAAKARTFLDTLQREIDGRTGTELQQVKDLKQWLGSAKIFTYVEGDPFNDGMLYFDDTPGSEERSEKIRTWWREHLADRINFVTSQITHLQTEELKEDASITLEDHMRALGNKWRVVPLVFNTNGDFEPGFAWEQYKADKNGEYSWHMVLSASGASDFCKAELAVLKREPADAVHYPFYRGRPGAYVTFANIRNHRYQFTDESLLAVTPTDLVQILNSNPNQDGVKEYVLNFRRRMEACEKPFVVRGPHVKFSSDKVLHVTVDLKDDRSRYHLQLQSVNDGGAVHNGTKPWRGYVLCGIKGHYGEGKYQNLTD